MRKLTVVPQVLVQENLLAAAQQGNPGAIATLINQVLWKRGITTKAKSKGSCLHIVMESARVPDQAFCAHFIYDGMKRLGASSIQSVRIYGKRKDRKRPAWTQIVQFRQSLQVVPAQLQPAPNQPPILTLVPQPKRVPKKLKAKPKKRIPLLVFGGTIWVAAAAMGVVVSSQLNAPVVTTDQTKPAPTAEQPTSKSSPTPKPKQKPPASPSAPVSPAAATSITIKAVGDIVPGTNFPNNRLPGDKRQLFQSVKSSLQGSDILFGNFESTMTNYPRPAKDTSRSMVFAFRNPPSYANLFKEVGFDILSVANNHSFDFFPAGFEDTMKNIEKAGVKAVGKKNQIVYMTVKNTKVAFIGFSYLSVHNSINNLTAAKALVAEAKKNAPIVAISVHAGAEGSDATRVKNKAEMFHGENRGNKVLFARTMIDSGADLVLGHGPHVPRAMELYKGKLIAYSLGNFIGYRTLSTAGVLGSSLVLEVKLNDQGDFLAGKIIPVQLDRRGIPYPDKGSRSVQLIRNLTKVDFPNTPLKIDSNGNLSKIGNK